LPLGGSGTYTSWTATGLPPGLSINSSTGVISGTPTNTGFFSATITVTDSAGNTLVQGVGLTVASPTGVTINLAGPFLGTFSGDLFRVINLNPTGGTGPYTVTALGSLPSGFALVNGSSLLANGVGTWNLDVFPFVAPGPYSFTFQVTDSAGNI